LKDIYECRYINTSITIDGDFDKPIWRKAEPIKFFLPVTYDQPQSHTEAGLLWDDNYLYAGFKAYDKDIFAYNTERDSSTCNDDVLEFFFKTNPNEEPYYNFEINALNTVYDAFNLRRHAAGGGHRWKRWDCAGLKSAVKIKGTINDPSDEDEYWSLEIAIPFSSLNIGRKIGDHPVEGREWTFHLARYDYSVYLKTGVELSSSARLSIVDFHKYEDWGRLVFTH
jgi:hypothetical protein